LRIIDVGTGSGAIALALAKEIQTAEIHATDISAAALEVARANAARHELTSRIEFHLADLLGAVPAASFDIVVSNPPYVGDSEEESVQLEVRKFEPRNAVFAGPTGVEVVERLIPQAREALRPGGWLVFEISGTIADRVRSLLSSWDEVAIRNDLQGIARVAIARKINPSKSSQVESRARRPFLHLPHTKTSRERQAAPRTEFQPWYRDQRSLPKRPREFQVASGW
jgi:release factor glutamine methyltransferase